MRTFEHICLEVASSSKQPLRYFAKTEIKSDVKCVFYSYIKTIVHYSLVIDKLYTMTKFDDKIIIYFMPRLETSKFLCNFKAKRYNVNLITKIF